MGDIALPDEQYVRGPGELTLPNKGKFRRNKMPGIATVSLIPRWLNKFGSAGWAARQRPAGAGHLQTACPLSERRISDYAFDTDFCSEYWLALPGAVARNLFP